VKQQQPSLDPKLVGSVLWIHRYTINTDACAPLIRPVCYRVLIEETWEEKTLKFPWTVNEKNTRAIENKNKGNRYIISMPYTFSASNFVLFLNLSERKNFKVCALNDFDSIISYSFSLFCIVNCCSIPQFENIFMTKSLHSPHINFQWRNNLG
jgi:hypothetical protein